MGIHVALMQSAVSTLHAQLLPYTFCLSVKAPPPPLSPAHPQRKSQKSLEEHWEKNKDHRQLREAVDLKLAIVLESLVNFRISQC